MRGSICKRGKTWAYVVDIGKDARTGKRKQAKKGGFATRAAAQQALAAVLVELQQGAYIAPSKLTVGEFLTEWLPSMRHTVRDNTFAVYRINIEKYIVPNVGGVKLQHLTPNRITRLYSDLLEFGGTNRRPLSSATVRNVHVTLRRALEDAPLQVNPAAKARPPRKQTKDVECWTARQLQQFLAAEKDNPLYMAFVLAASTGMRRSEVLGLRWEDVDLQGECLAVQQVVTVGVHGRVSVTAPKTASSRRRIDLDTATVRALKQWRLQSGTFSGLVFSRPDRQPLDPTRFSQAFAKAVKRSGLPPLTFHGLRHTWATLALKSGVPTKVVQERLGHSSIQVTSDIYQHVTEGMQRQAADQVAALIWAN